MVVSEEVVQEGGGGGVQGWVVLEKLRKKEDGEDMLSF